MKSFKKMLPSNCEVIDCLPALRLANLWNAQVKRDGKWISVPARELVVGDLIRVHTGRKVPADGRIIQTERAPRAATKLASPVLACRVQG